MGRIWPAKQPEAKPAATKKANMSKQLLIVDDEPLMEPDNEMVKIAKKEIQAMKAGLFKNQTKEEKIWD